MTVLNIPDVYMDPCFNPALDQKMGYQTKSMLLVPVMSMDEDREVAGVLQIVNKLIPLIPDDPTSPMKVRCFTQLCC